MIRIKCISLQEARQVIGKLKQDDDNQYRIIKDGNLYWVVRS